MSVFDDLAVHEETAAWGRRTVAATHVDGMLHGYSATIVADTRNPRTGDRLTTMVVRFPRCILPEMNTHRVFSRNSASSRARSVRTTISGVMDDPYIPIFTRNGKGMSGSLMGQGADRDQATRIWLAARDAAVSSELSILLGDLYTGTPESVADDWSHWIDVYYDKVYHSDTPVQGAPSVHKQNANRIIEPYMWHEALITSSYWDNFFTLRLDDAAQPEMHATAAVMKAAMNISRPEESPIHSPFVEPDDPGDPEDVQAAFMRSAAECARISYRDRTAIGLSEGNDLGKRMLDSGHMSPFEHQAIDKAEFRRMGLEAESDEGHLCGNLSPEWVQFRHILA